jgi:hypothetical protein
MVAEVKFDGNHRGNLYSPHLLHKSRYRKPKPAGAAEEAEEAAGWMADKY